MALLRIQEFRGLGVFGLGGFKVEGFGGLGLKSLRSIRLRVCERAFKLRRPEKRRVHLLATLQ